MAQLQTRALPDTHAGRDAFDHGPLGRADGGDGVGGIVVSLQVDHAHRAAAYAAVEQGALHIDVRVREAPQKPCVQIAAHGLVDGGNARLFAGAELGLGKGDAAGGGMIARLLAHRFPVVRLGGELIAGDDGPVGKKLPRGNQ